MGLFALVEFPTLIVLGGLGLTAGFFLWRSQRCLAARPNEVPAPSDCGMQARETRRELSEQLDSKIDVLQRLVHQADRVAARLETLLEAAQPPAGPASHPLADSDPTPVRPSNQAEALEWAGRSTGDGAVRETRREEAADQRLPAEQRYEEIYRLADYGFDTTEIARRANTPEGEVELILDLRGRRGT